MKFTSTALLAMMAALASAAPSPSPAKHNSVSDFTPSAPISDEALARLEAKVITPGPAANIIARSSSETETVEKRDITHVYICQDANFGGRCQNLDSERQSCYNLYNGWNDVVTSLGPDSGTTCCLYDDYGCNGGSLCNIINPGIWNLNDYGWNDRASAYRCW